MLDKLFKLPAHRYLYPFGLFVLAVGIPLSKVLMSIGTIWVISNLVLEYDWKNDWKNLKENKLIRWILALILLHILGMFYTEDLESGFHDLAVKMPLFVVPFVLACKPLIQKKDIHFILFGFLISTAITAIINLGYYFQWWTNSETIHNYREISHFGSHIRSGMCVIMSLILCFYFMKDYRKIRPLLICLIFMFLVFIYYSQVMSSYFILGVIGFVFLIQFAFLKLKKIVFYPILGVILLGYFISGIFCYQLLFPTPPKKVFYTKTISGNKYAHFKNNEQFENTHYVWHNICEKEFNKSWLKKFGHELVVKPESNDMEMHTAIRYFTSKGLNKDSVGFSKLNEQDFININNKIANHLIAEGGIKARLIETATSLRQINSLNNSGSLIRFLYWKIGLSLIQKNILFGVGTGDVQLAFNQVYRYEYPTLTAENKLHTHNQYLTFAISFGILGMLIFIGAIIHFGNIQRKNNNLIGIAFIIAFALSCLTEDTLETQMGVSFFCLFWSIFQQKTKEEPKSI